MSLESRQVHTKLHQGELEDLPPAHTLTLLLLGQWYQNLQVKEVKRVKDTTNINYIHKLTRRS